MEEKPEQSYKSSCVTSKINKNLTRTISQATILFDFVACVNEAGSLSTSQGCLFALQVTLTTKHYQNRINIESKRTKCRGLNCIMYITFTRQVQFANLKGKWRAEEMVNTKHFLCNSIVPS